MNHLEFYITMDTTEQWFMTKMDVFCIIEDRQGIKNHPYQRCIEMHLSPVVHAQHLKKEAENHSPFSARVQPLRWNLHSDLLVRSMFSLFTFRRSASAAVDHHRHLLDSVGIVHKLLEGV